MADEVSGGAAGVDQQPSAALDDKLKGIFDAAQAANTSDSGVDDDASEEPEQGDDASGSDDEDGESRQSESDAGGDESDEPEAGDNGDEDGALGEADPLESLDANQIAAVMKSGIRLDDFRSLAKSNPGKAAGVLAGLMPGNSAESKKTEQRPSPALTEEACIALFADELDPDAGKKKGQELFKMLGPLYAETRGVKEASERDAQAFRERQFVVDAERTFESMADHFGTGPSEKVSPKHLAERRKAFGLAQVFRRGFEAEGVSIPNEEVVKMAINHVTSQNTKQRAVAEVKKQVMDRSKARTIAKNQARAGNAPGMSPEQRIQRKLVRIYEKATGAA